jgi:hypothetical protein
MLNVGNAWRIGALVSSIGIVGCGMSRSAEEVQNMPRPEPKAWVPVERSPADVNRVIPAAGREMEMAVEKASDSPGKAWVLHRGMRLRDPAFFFRVDVEPVPGSPNRSLVAVVAYPVGRNIIDSHELATKPSELAYRIASLALTEGGAK